MVIVFMIVLAIMTLAHVVATSVKLDELNHRLDVMATMITENDRKRMLYADVEVAVKKQLESVRLVVGSHVGSAGNSETTAKKHDPYRSPNTISRDPMWYTKDLGTLKRTGG